MQSEIIISILLSAVSALLSLVAILFMKYLNSRFKPIEAVIVEFREEIANIRAFEMNNSKRMDGVIQNYLDRFAEVNQKLATVIANQKNTHETLKKVETKLDGTNYMTKEMCDMIHKTNK